MPRPPRYSFPGAIHHVMLRGNQGRQIFYSDTDRIRCCLLIQEGIERFGHRIHGFCLMSNHIHLAWQEGEETLSTGIQNLAFRYAQYVNLKRKEVGHVFQGRFKSILVNKDDYLTRLVRYIHLNPVRAGIVTSPEDYMWSGHNAYLGVNPISWVERDYILKRYSEVRETAIKRYNEYIHTLINAEQEIDFKTGFESGIIGDDTFIKDCIEMKFAKDRNLSITTSSLIDQLCSSHNISESEIISPNKRRDLVHVRAILALFVRDIEGLSIVELANLLKRDPGGLSRLASKLEKKCKNFPCLNEEIKILKDKVFKESIA